MNTAVSKTNHIFIHDDVGDESYLESFNFEEPVTFPNYLWKPELLK